MAQQQGQSGGGDDSMAPVWIMVALFIAVYVIWLMARVQIVSFIFFIDILQAKLVALVLGPSTLSNEIQVMQTIDPASITWTQLMQLTGNVGNYTRYPLCAFLLCMAIVLYRSD